MEQLLKNQSIFRRFLYAWAGIKASWRSEKSFRDHIFVFAGVVLLLVLTRPAPIWWALLLLADIAMIAAELINTAVEKLVDYLHPGQHEVIGVVKDTLSGAVFVLCLAGGIVLIAFLCAEL